MATPPRVFGWLPPFSGGAGFCAAGFVPRGVLIFGSCAAAPRLTTPLVSTVVPDFAFFPSPACAYTRPVRATNTAIRTAVIRVLIRCSLGYVGPRADKREVRDRKSVV